MKRKLGDLRKKAEQGNADAQFGLAMMYRNGRGVTRDDVEAVKGYRLAAEQGYAKAQYNLALMYDKGSGVTRDDVEAWAWFNMAAISGDEDAVWNRDNLENRLGTQATLAAQRRSKELLKQIEARKLKSGG